jgi:V/A-type H+/Na+-transporting ATPase subunit F
MSKVIFITPEDARYGFGLAGATQEITAGPETVATLQRVADDPGVGLIFLDERLHQHLDSEWLAHFEKHWPGMLVVLPAPARLAAPELDYAMQLIVRAIGYQVRL